MTPSLTSRRGSGSGTEQSFACLACFANFFGQCKKVENKEVESEKLMSEKKK